MKAVGSSTVLMILLIINLWGCESASNVNEKTITNEIKNPPDSAFTVNKDTSEIKDDLRSEKVKENKFTEKDAVGREYAIQIGAFSSESNALTFINKAKNRLPQNIYYKDFQGLYKVRLGNFSSKDEAMAVLEKIVSDGFTDSFLVELTYVKTPD